jgi:hypothetical protein
MKTLVVVESVFGNTLQIADAVARGLARTADVRVVDVVDAPREIEGIDLLVVGGPTHAFGMTRPQTRQAAAEQSDGSVVPAAVGLREWLGTLRVSHIAGAAFDTRTDRVRLPGSAAGGAARALRRLGIHMIARPTTFRVLGTRGPLRDGELERAEAWGAALAADPAIARTGTGTGT